VVSAMPLDGTNLSIQKTKVNIIIYIKKQHQSNNMKNQVNLKNFSKSGLIFKITTREISYLS
jgi:hypothetical protein